jgi:glucosamine--fructose-6-phosphate aminotransferase (isomerizing)
VKARAGRIIVICNEGDHEVAEMADHVITIPQTLISCIRAGGHPAPAARVSHRGARGCDVDQPRNLAKSVTVE